jgi:hypothetical protein
MANERQEPKPVFADPDVRMDTELEADPMLTLSEGKASGVQIVSVGLAIVAAPRPGRSAMRLSRNMWLALLTYVKLKKTSMESNLSTKGEHNVVPSNVG